MRQTTTLNRNEKKTPVIQQKHAILTAKLLKYPEIQQEHAILIAMLLKYPQPPKPEHRTKHSQNRPKHSTKYTHKNWSAHHEQPRILPLTQQHHTHSTQHRSQMKKVNARPRTFLTAFNTFLKSSSESRPCTVVRDFRPFRCWIRIWTYNWELPLLVAPSSQSASANGSTQPRRQ